MEPRISIIALGVSDLNRAIGFYRDGLGLPTNYKDGDGVAFFQLKSTWLELYPYEALAEDAGLPADRARFGGITLAHNVGSKEEVDHLLGQAIAAGAAPLRPAQEMFWGGYSGYFADPDGHPWEIAWNPVLSID